jgi:hypothetical protein
MHCNWYEETTGNGASFQIKPQIVLVSTFQVWQFSLEAPCKLTQVDQIDLARQLLSSAQEANLGPDIPVLVSE